MTELLNETGMAGVYLDTLGAVPAGWAEQMASVLGRQVFFGSEGHPWDERIVNMHTAWGQGWAVTPHNQIYNTKWIWPEHKTFLTSDRHSRDKWDEVASAFFGGLGILVWENVFGDDISCTERDKALLRALLPLQRILWQHFHSLDWQPYVQSGHQDLYVNRWPHEATAVLTFAWIGEDDYAGPLVPAREGFHYYDLIAGSPLALHNGWVFGAVGHRSVGAVFETADGDLMAPLAAACPGSLPRYEQVNVSRFPPPVRVSSKAAGSTAQQNRGSEALSEGMVWIPEGEFTCVIHHPWPWGADMDEARVNNLGATMPVGRHDDASPFGVRDLCGHVWQWVDDVYEDRVHRFTVLKGGSYFRLPESASRCYIHTGPCVLSSHIKAPLLDDTLDRFSTVGFRCVRD